MSEEKVPVAFASALEIGGPTNDGMVHITFTRHSLSSAKDSEGKDLQLGDVGFKGREVEVWASMVPVTTVMVPYQAFRNFGKIFTDVGNSMEQSRLEQRRKAAKAKAEREAAQAAAAEEAEADARDGDGENTGEA